MFFGVIASWKLECKCKRLLWTEYWYSKLFRLLWKFLNITDIDYLRSISKHKGMKNLEKREVRLHTKVRWSARTFRQKIKGVLHVRNNYDWRHDTIRTWPVFPEDVPAHQK